MERMNNLKCCLCWKASMEFITETITHIALKHLPFISINCKFVPPFLQYVLSTYWMPGILVDLGAKTTYKIDRHGHCPHGIYSL